ncbi:MAG: PleD family two-component system response regulator [Kiloniellaceae bacterium]
MSVRPIILAEDNDKLRRMYSDMLEAAGFTVMGASDGEKAIGLLHKIVNPQLIILDVMMPRMDGIETCIRVRKMQGLRPCPILFLTALDNPDTLLECLRAGGDDYLVKSAPLNEVVERVQFWSRKGSSEESTERRLKAIRELESLVAEEAPDNGAPVADEICGDQATVAQLADFINNVAATFSGDDEQLLYRFGYVVGLVTSCVEPDSGGEGRFNRFLRNLVYKTGFVDRKEVDALLDNYERIISQSRFQQGWMRGRGDAPKVGLPQLNRLNERFAEELG